MGWHGCWAGRGRRLHCQPHTSCRRTTNMVWAASARASGPPPPPPRQLRTRVVLLDVARVAHLLQPRHHGSKVQVAVWAYTRGAQRSRVLQQLHKGAWRQAGVGGG